MHCDYLIAVEDADLGMPEVTLPVVPGMEGCHWPFRKASADQWPKLLRLLLTGRSVKAKDAIGWLVDDAAALEDAVRTAWSVATGGSHRLAERKIAGGPLDGMENTIADLDLPSSGNPATEAARKAILENVEASCSADFAEAITIQARHSGNFMITSACKSGRIGAEYKKTMLI
jgi:enoyl-CoA hydratase/carnithine racemase